MTHQEIILSNLKRAVEHMMYVCHKSLPPAWLMIRSEIEFDSKKALEMINECRKRTNEELEKMDKNDPWYLWKRGNSKDPEIGVDYILEHIGYMEKHGTYNGKEWNIRIYAY